jgi:PAS domain S-box-containing protein
MLWLLGVLVLTLVMVSSLVLWHERRELESELYAQGDLLANLLALAAADGGSPEYLAVLSLTDLAAGEVRSISGEVLWRFGPPIVEVQNVDDSLLEVERRVEVGAGAWGRSREVRVKVLMSRARIQRFLAGAAIRLVVALGFALALAMLVGLWMISRVVQPLNELAALSRTFDPELPVEPIEGGGAAAELVELAAAFRGMTRRLADQRQSLAASEKRYRELFSSSPTPLIELDSELAVRGANPAAATFIGDDLSRIIGRRFMDYVVGGRDESLTTVLHSAATGDEGVVEARWRLPDGDLAEVELHLRPAVEGEGGGFIAAIHDLTDRVRRLGERWQRTFDAMIDGVALVDHRGRIVVANRALASHVPVLSAELAERQVEDGGWRTRSLDRLLECTMTRPQGRRHAILVVRDITEAVTSEARLREAEKMQAVATLASGVAHDFNNLLAAILLHVRWLESSPSEVGNAAQAIRELAEEGSEVVGELLLFARSDVDAPPLTFDLAALVRDQRAVLNHILPEGVTLSLELPEAPVAVTGQPVALRRLVLNLVGNARDAVAAEGGEITISVAQRGGRAVLEVTDTGPGIAEEFRERLFEPFFTLSRQGRGAGLGLAVVYAIASAHGGDVELASGAGESARFVVRLPPGDALKIEALGETEGEQGPAAGPRVLVIESDGRRAMTLVEALALAGFDVRHAADGTGAQHLAMRWEPQALVVGGDQSVAIEGALTGLSVLSIDDPERPRSVSELIGELKSLDLAGAS